MAPGEHIAFTGKAGSPIWVGRKRFELEGRVKILFTPEELIEGDKIVIAHAEAWLLRGDVLHRARLYNMPIVHFSAGGTLHPFQRCVWNGLFVQSTCPDIESVVHGRMENLESVQIQAKIRSCEVLPACEDGSEWRELSPPRTVHPDLTSTSQIPIFDFAHETYPTTVRYRQRESTGRHHQS